MSDVSGPRTRLSPGARGARLTLWLVLAAGFVLLLKLNLPGHMSWDSVTALHEGRFRVRESWNPAIFGWLLGVLDRFARGDVAFVILSGLLLFGGWAALTAVRPRASWLAPAAGLAALSLPQVLIYPAIVWKDVLFAETTVAGFVALAVAARDPDRPPRIVTLALAAVLFAAAGLLRQNGLLFALAATVALAWAGWRFGALRSLARAGAWLVVVGVLTLAFSALLQPQGPGAPDTAGGKGVRILETYDVVAATALSPGRPLTVIERNEPAAARILKSRGVLVYSPERIDFLSFDPAVDAAMAAVSSADFQAEWVRLVTQDPGLYLKARFAAFRQVFATPVIDHCLPIEVGVEGPANYLKALGIAMRQDARDGRLYNYTTWFLDTPAMSHVAWAGLALAVVVLLLIRREPADLIVAAMVAGGLVFAASFFVISIACDYRYLYALDLTALTGLIYLAADPRLTRR
jgi:hypothetical protein